MKSVERNLTFLVIGAIGFGLFAARYCTAQQAQLNGSIIIVVPVPTAQPGSPEQMPATPPPGEVAQLPAAPVALVQTTGGRATVRIDLTNFHTAPPLDQYPAATILWQFGPNGEVDTTSPVLELQIRGSTDEHCLVMPCGDTSLGLSATYSASIVHDANEPDETKKCGDSIKFGKRLPIGPGNTVDVLLEWGPDSRKLSVAVLKDIWKAEYGTQHVGFGVAVAGVPNPPKGIGYGWGREEWSIQKHGGSVSLVSWEKVEPAPARTLCELAVNPQ